MEFFDKLSESLVSAGKDVSQKAKDVSEIAKLKLDIKSKEDYVQKQYEELGRSYYEKHKDEEECEEADFPDQGSCGGDRAHESRGSADPGFCRMSEVRCEDAGRCCILQQLWYEDG